MTDELFLGLDLAWARRNRTGLALTDVSGALVASGVVRSDDEIGAWLAEQGARHHAAVAVVAVDGPLVVRNESGHRAADRALSRDFARFKASTHVTHRGMPWCDPPRGEELAERFGWTVSPSEPGSGERPVAIEVYPHAAMVGLFGLSERILYKKGADRAAGFAQLVECFETLEELRLGESSRWAELRALALDPGRGDLTRIEDEIDAILCAHLAWRWRHDRDGLQVYGTAADGFVVSPPPPRVRG